MQLEKKVVFWRRRWLTFFSSANKLMISWRPKSFEDRTGWANKVKSTKILIYELNSNLDSCQVVLMIRAVKTRSFFFRNTSNHFFESEAD